MACRLICHHGGITCVRRLDIKFERAICRRLKIVGRLKLAAPLLHKQEARVGVCQIDLATRLKQARNNTSPTAKSGSQQRVPQVTKTRSNGPGVRRGA